MTTSTRDQPASTGYGASASPGTSEQATKAARILAAAREAFFAEDYEAVTMDAVAQRAGVVKQTVYSHHPGKEALFKAVYDQECRQIGALLEVAPFTVGADAAAQLRQLGQAFIEILLGSRFRDLTRVTVAATRRFPDIGSSIYTSTIEPALGQFADILGDAMDRGLLLRASDPAEAALQLTALLRGELFFRCLLDRNFVPSEDQRTRQVEAAVECFLARYGVAPAGG